MLKHIRKIKPSNMLINLFVLFSRTQNMTTVASFLRITNVNYSY